MKNLFSWRLRPSESDFTKLWEDATFVFDTNFLLDLYRVSRATSEDFLRILEQLQNRIWLPYQVASEFLDRREITIDSEASSFQKALKTLEKWKDEQRSFKSLRGQLKEAGRILASEMESFFGENDSYLESVDLFEKHLRKKIEELSNSHSPLDSNEDHILDKILSLFEGKVGNPYEIMALPKLYKEGEERYSREQPPGFMDAEKGEDERKYGDFILWKQILDFAKSKSSSIIFVTGEKKRDWWFGKDGETIFPHAKLRYEFYEQVKQSFWMYPTQIFLKMAKERLAVEVDPRSIEETNAIAVEALNEEAANAKQAYSDNRMRELFELSRKPFIDDKTRELFELSRRPFIDERMRELIELSIRPAIDSGSSVAQTLKQIQQSILDSGSSVAQTLKQIQQFSRDDPAQRWLKQSQPLTPNVKDLEKQKTLQEGTSDLTEKGQLAQEADSETLSKEETESSGTDEIPPEDKKAKPTNKKPPRKRSSGNAGKKPDAGNS